MPKRFCPQLYNFVPNVKSPTPRSKHIDPYTHINIIFADYVIHTPSHANKNEPKNKKPAQLVTNASGCWEN